MSQFRSGVTFTQYFGNLLEMKWSGYDWSFCPPIDILTRHVVAASLGLNVRKDMANVSWWANLEE